MSCRVVVCRVVSGVVSRVVSRRLVPTLPGFVDATAWTTAGRAKGAATAPSLRAKVDFTMTNNAAGLPLGNALADLTPARSRATLIAPHGALSGA
jgi:hypothetical protein